MPKAHSASGTLKDFNPSEPALLIAGIDLAAEPKGTALSVLEVRSTEVVLKSIEIGLDDQSIVSACSNVEKIGIDCALGWPIAFTDFVTSHASKEYERAVRW